MRKPSGGQNPPPTGLIIIGDKKPEPGPSKRDLLISSLKWAVDLEKTPVRTEVQDHVSGLAAYDAWADALETDVDYPQDNPDIIGNRCSVHGDQCTMLCDRSSASKYLGSMIYAAPEAADDLKAAGALYQEVADLCAKIWPWNSCYFGDPVIRKAITDSNVRREIAKAVRIAKETEAKAVEHLEKALQTLI